MNFKKEDFAAAIGLWEDWNSKINVVSRKDTDSLFEHHVLHSLAIAEYLSREGMLPLDGSVLDLGTGGGFPGIPLAMVMPETQFTLCDSIAKKIKVARAVAGGIGLRNVTFANARAESLDGKFDWVVSRAVASLDDFYPLVKDRFRKGILYLKGGDVNPEIAQMCGHWHVEPGKIAVWPVSEWLPDDYFKEKFVIHVKK